MEVQSQIEQLISKGEIRLALEKLKNRFNGINSTDEIVILINNLNRLESSERKGILNSEELRIEKNRICSSALELAKSPYFTRTPPYFSFSLILNFSICLLCRSICTIACSNNCSTS